ncbi:hypothetical protein V3C99_008060 [Haemonchus contortus]|uniref:Secreted protein n=1 Tax=Haemonchus contortus TaxID=6289 RepID=A0A7I4YPL1_HAECO|nr:unnamed protein product [Haemonchus contortus]CDJ96404.1 unnamed protein product [Haemonchus contortus]
MRLFILTLILALMSIASVVAKPRTLEVTTKKPAHTPRTDKSKPKAHSNQIRPRKRANPNADLLFLDQLIL